MMLIDGQEIEERFLEYAVRDKRTSDLVYITDTQRDAEFQALLYEDAEIVCRQVFETGWAIA